MAINKLSTSKGKIKGVANCASFGAEKTTEVLSSTSCGTLRCGTRLVHTLVVAGGGAAGLLGGLFGGGAGQPAPFTEPKRSGNPGAGAPAGAIQRLPYRPGPLPPGAIQSGPYRPGALPPGAIQPLAGGAPAGGGGVAGPDVAMNNLAQALNAVKDGFQINVGEINVTISNATELANSIKSVVVEAVKESVGSADLNNAPAAGSVSSMTDGPPGAYA